MNGGSQPDTDRRLRAVPDGTEEDRIGEMVGLVGFEPTTSCSQSRRAAKLRHSPVGRPL